MIEDLWYKNAVIYSLDLETFLDSDGDGVGDLDAFGHRPEDRVARAPEAGAVDADEPLVAAGVRPPGPRRARRVLPVGGRPLVRAGAFRIREGDRQRQCRTHGAHQT